MRMSFRGYRVSTEDMRAAQFAQHLGIFKMQFSASYSNIGNIEHKMTGVRKRNRGYSMSIQRVPQLIHAGRWLKALSGCPHEAIHYQCETQSRSKSLGASGHKDTYVRAVK